MSKIPFLLLFLLFITCQFDNNKSEPSRSDTSVLTTSGNPALDGISAELAQTPDDPTLRARRASIFYEEGQYGAAIADLQVALQRDSVNPVYLHLLADAYLDNNQSFEAIATMKKVTELYPERILSLLKLSEFQLILRQYEDAIQTINQVVKIDPLHPEAYFMLGMVFKEKGDMQRAMGSFQTAVEYDPDLVDGWIHLGQLHAEEGNPLAKNYFENAVKVAPNNINALHAQAEYLHFSDKPREAIEVYRKINILNPTYEESLFNTGIIYLEMDSLQQAAYHFDLAVKASPTYIIAYYYRGLVSEMQGKWQAAKNDYQQALNFNPNYERAREGLERIKNQEIE